MPRGSNVELTRELPDLTGVVVGITWDAGAETTLDDALVGAVLLCNSARKVISDDHFVFFNQLSSPDLSVAMLETALAADKEQVEIDLTSVPDEVVCVFALLYINDSPGRRRSLGQLRSCRVRVLNLEDNCEIVRSEDLAATLDAQTAMVLGEIYRHHGGWKFRVIGQGYSSGIRGVADDYGVAL